jgi:hypothetical protein
VPTSIKPSVEGDITRGTKVTFTIQDPPKDISVQSWAFEETLETGKKVKVPRPKNDGAETWNTSWEGQMVVPGKIIVKYQIKKKISKGKWDIKNEKPLEYEVKVVARTGDPDPWRSTVKRHEEQPTSTIPNNFLGGQSKPTVPPQKFPDLGLHVSRTEPEKYVPKTINLTKGPNRGYSIFDIIQLEFHSYGYINDDLRNAQSQFSTAQDGNAYFTMGNSPTLNLVKSRQYYTISGKTVKVSDEERFRKDHSIPVYITSPPPKRPIASNDWTLSGNSIKLVISEDDFRKKYNIGDKAYSIVPESYRLMFPRIGHADLLKYTQRHEYAGNPNSHRANFEKLVRALDPKAYAENLISRPGAQVNLTQLLNNRLKLLSEDDRHRIVDEETTKNEKKVRYIEGDRIFGCNEDDTGNLVGIVWNPANNQSFPATQ